MTSKRFCDRCGKEIPDAESSYIHVWVPPVYTSNEGNRLDLCFDCTLAFYELLASKEPVEPKEGTFAWMLKDMSDDGSRHYRREHETCKSIYMYRGQLLSDNGYGSAVLSVNDIKADDWEACVPIRAPPKNEAQGRLFRHLWKSDD